MNEKRRSHAVEVSVALLDVSFMQRETEAVLVFRYATRTFEEGVTLGEALQAVLDKVSPETMEAVFGNPLEIFEDLENGEISK